MSFAATLKYLFSQFAVITICVIALRLLFLGHIARAFVNQEAPIYVDPLCNVQAVIGAIIGTFGLQPQDDCKVYNIPILKLLNIIIG